MGGLSSGPIPDPHTSPNLPNRWVEKPPFEFAAKSATADSANHVGVVERPDHHCGDDLVLFICVWVARLQRSFAGEFRIS